MRGSDSGGHRHRRRVQRQPAALQPAQELQRLAQALLRRPEAGGIVEVDPLSRGCGRVETELLQHLQAGGDGAGRQQRGDAVAGRPPDRGQGRPQWLALSL